MKTPKTNAMRLLDAQNIPYQTHVYPHADGAIDGVSVAHKLKQNPAQVFKTLVTQGASRNYYVFVVPVEKELDLKAAAKAVGEKAVAMIPVADINKVTGYIRGGCSPIGMKKQFVTTLDQSAFLQPTIFVSAGKIGQQIQISAHALAQLLGAASAQLTE